MRKFSLFGVAFFACVLMQAVFGEWVPPGSKCGIATYTQVPCSRNMDCNAWSRAECLSNPDFECVAYSYFPRQNISVNCLLYKSKEDCEDDVDPEPVIVNYPDQFCLNI